MKVRYSKNALKSLLSMPESTVSDLLKEINLYVKSPELVRSFSVVGSSDRRKFFQCGPYYVVIKQTVFKGHTVQYVTEILTEEDYQYTLF